MPLESFACFRLSGFPAKTRFESKHTQDVAAYALKPVSTLAVLFPTHLNACTWVRRWLSCITNLRLSINSMIRRNLAEEIDSVAAVARGEFAEIGELVGKPDHVHRLQELGLSSGTVVEMVQPGSPCIVRLAGQSSASAKAIRWEFWFARESRIESAFRNAVGQHGRVLEVQGTDSVSLRLMEMGLTPGVHFRMIGKAPLGDPLELKFVATVECPQK